MLQTYQGDRQFYLKKKEEKRLHTFYHELSRNSINFSK